MTHPFPYRGSGAPSQRSQLPLQLRPALTRVPDEIGGPLLKSMGPLRGLNKPDDKQALKHALMDELNQWMQAKDLKQYEAAQILGIAPSRVSDAINKKAIKFSVDALIDLLAKVGKQVRITVL
jgi:predicted XRE-type DNA-binding protein